MGRTLRNFLFALAVGVVGIFAFLHVQSHFRTAENENPLQLVDDMQRNLLAMDHADPSTQAELAKQCFEKAKVLLFKYEMVSVETKDCVQKALAYNVVSKPELEKIVQEKINYFIKNGKPIQLGPYKELLESISETTSTRSPKSALK